MPGRAAPGDSSGRQPPAWTVSTTQPLAEAPGLGTGSGAFSRVSFRGETTAHIELCLLLLAYEREIKKPPWLKQ